MWEFVVGGVVYVVDAGTKGQAANRLRARLQADGINIDVGQLGSIVDSGRIISPTDVKPGSKFVQATDGGDFSTVGDGEDPGGGGVGGAGIGDVNDEITAQINESKDNVLGIDVNRFPFSSFANALQNRRGLDVNGVQGATLRGFGNELINALDVGANVGTVDPFGEAAGAQERFFGSQLGRPSDLAQRTFDALRAGSAREGLDPDGIIINSLRNPTLGTDAGDRDFKKVGDLARGAATGRFGAFGQQFLPQQGQLREAFERRLARGGQPDFLSFVSSQFGV